VQSCLILEEGGGQSRRMRDYFGAEMVEQCLLGPAIRWGAQHKEADDRGFLLFGTLDKD
jgi:hypothetical protein